MLTLGWGFRAQAPQTAFADCWRQACAQLPALAAAQSAAPLRLVVLESKGSTESHRYLMGWCGAILPNTAWWLCPDAAICDVATPHRSARLLQRFGTGSVCEALALHAARHWAQADAGAAAVNPSPPVRLLLPRTVSTDRSATLAVAGPFEFGDFS